MQQQELHAVEWLSVEEIIQSEKSSVLIKELAQKQITNNFIPIVNGLNPGEVFNYTAYKLFYNEN